MNLECLKVEDLIDVEVHSIPHMISPTQMIIPFTISFYDEDGAVVKKSVGSEVGITAVLANPVSVCKALMEISVNTHTGRTQYHNINNYDLDFHLLNDVLRSKPEVVTELQRYINLYTRLAYKDRMLNTFLTNTYWPDWLEMHRGMVNYQAIIDASTMFKKKEVQVKWLNPLIPSVSECLKNILENGGIAEPNDSFNRERVLTSILKEFSNESGENFSVHTRLILTGSCSQYADSLGKSLELLKCYSVIFGFTTADSLPESFLTSFYHSLFLN